MSKPLSERMVGWLTDWLMQSEIPDPTQLPLSDFERLRYEIKQCDVLLVEGQSRVSEVIRIITQSPWTHSMLYIGHLREIENPLLRQQVREAFTGDENEQLVIEGLLGKGTIVTPLSAYKDAHLRICRPRGISQQDAQRVIGYAIGRLGVEYDVRQILDLARLLLPWGILPRRWRSALFQHKAGGSTKEICSSLLAEAFEAVHFPILPVLRRTQDAGIELIPRHPRLLTPSDFDYSPYFEIIKYPFSGVTEVGSYHNLPWTQTGEYATYDGTVIRPTATIPAPKTQPQKSTLNTPDSPVKPAPLSDTITETKSRHHWFSHHKADDDNDEV